MTHGFRYRSVVKPAAPDLFLDPSIRVMSELQISSHLRERMNVFNAQRLISRAHDAQNREKASLLDKAMTLLNGCNIDDYKGATGGLGPEILRTKVLCEEESGRSEKCVGWCEELIKRYPGSWRVQWARDRIDSLKRKK
jgi:hypothetical protein